MTISGTYELATRSVTGEEKQRETFTDKHWFAEVGLFCTVPHSSSLLADDVGDTFHLSGADFAECVRGYPGARRLACEYCKIFLGDLGWSPQAAIDYLPEEASLRACKGTSC